MGEESKVREAVGVFENIKSLDKAVTELEGAAFSRDTISMLGNRKSMKEKLGKPEVQPECVEDSSSAPRQVPLRTEEKAIGTGVIIGGGAYIGSVGILLAAGAATSIPAIITAAVIGAGAGGILAKILGGHFDKSISKQIEKGGLVLWVQTRDTEREKLACEILKKHGAKHVHIHEVK